MTENAQETSTLDEITPVNIIVAGATATGKSTIAQIIKEALEAKGFHPLFKDDSAPMGKRMLEKAVTNLVEKGCPMKIITLQLGRAGMTAIGNLDQRQNKSNLIVPGRG